MKESIYTIPISEVFEPKTGCPLCALEASLEARWVSYITGPAMMEPDVRLRTNQEGFCGRHLELMLEQRNRLSVALLLQTRLQHLLEALEEAPKGGRGLSRGKTAPEAGDCFLCNRIQGEMNRLGENLGVLWAREEAFRQLYAQQEYLCLPHSRLISGVARGLGGKDRARLLAETSRLLRQGLEAVKGDVDAFCQLFDHRSGTERPPAAVASAVERAAVLLCGHPNTQCKK